MTTDLNYVIKFVADMNTAIAFYRDVVGLKLKFQSPDWSEFVTGPTTLALHAASERKPSGRMELGFGVPDLDGFYNNLRRQDVTFPQAPRDEHGHRLATFLDCDGNECSVTGK